MAQLELKTKAITGSSVTMDGQTVGLLLTDVENNEVAVTMPVAPALTAAMNLIVAADAALVRQNIGERPLFNIRETFVHRSDTLSENQCVQTMVLEAGGSITFVLNKAYAEQLLQGLVTFLEGELPDQRIKRQ